MIGDRRPLVVARRWARRSAHTSVERFLDYLPECLRLTRGFERPYRLLRAVSDRVARTAGRDGYTSVSVGLEARAAWETLRHRPSLVHFLYADHDLHYFPRWARRRRVPLAATLFFSIEELERRMPDRSFLRDVDLVLASGREQETFLRRELGDRLAYLPLGVDCDFFRPSETAAGSEASEGRKLLQVGINRRDFGTLRAVVARLRQNLPDLELQMVGCGEAKEEFADVPDVVFHPFLDDEGLRAVYLDSDVMVLPLLEGGSSNALNEALACGLPVVATEMPNLVDYTDPSCVRTTPPGDAEAMAAACLEWLTGEPQRREAAAAARRLAETFDWQRVAERLRGLYSERLGVESAPEDTGP